MPLVDTGQESYRRKLHTVELLPESQKFIGMRLSRGAARVAVLEAILDGKLHRLVDVFKPRHNGAPSPGTLSHTVNITDIRTPGFGPNQSGFWLNWDVGKTHIEVALNANGTPHSLSLGDNNRAYFFGNGRLVELEFSGRKINSGRKPFPSLVTDVVERLLDKSIKQLSERGVVRHG